MNGMLAVTLKRSLIGCPRTQRLTVEGLGLRKLQQTVVLPDNPAVRGSILKVRHLVEVREATE